MVCARRSRLARPRITATVRFFRPFVSIISLLVGKNGLLLCPYAFGRLSVYGINRIFARKICGYDGCGKTYQGGALYAGAYGKMAR